MKILNFIASLLPSFDKQRIINNIATLQSDLAGTTLKSYQDAGKTFAAKKFAAPVNQALEKAYHGKMGGNKSLNFISAIELILKGLPAKLGFLETLVDSNYSHDVMRDAITYQKANVLKYLEVVEFVLTYANRLLLDVLAAETFQAQGKPELIGSNQPPIMTKWMAAHLLSFLDAMKVLELPLAETKEKIEAIPDITVVPDNATIVEETVGASKLDPMGLGFLITTWANPIYHLRMAFSEWQVERYKAKQEEKRALEYRLLALQEAYQNKSDPKLQQTIQYTEGRLQNLNRKLSEIESDYAA